MDDDEDHQEDRTPCQTNPIVGDFDVRGREDGSADPVQDGEKHRDLEAEDVGVRGLQHQGVDLEIAHQMHQDALGC